MKYKVKLMLKLFPGLLINSIQLNPNNSSAFVKFTTVDDVEFAIKRNDKKSNMRIYRSSDQHMKSGQNGNKTQLLSHSSSHISHSTKSDPKIDPKTDDSHRAM